MPRRNAGDRECGARCTGNAWRYRDYVVRAFNEDKPYDVFITEQLAGDLFPNPTDDQRLATTLAETRERIQAMRGRLAALETRVEADLDRIVLEQADVPCVVVELSPERERALNITLTGQLGNAGDTITLEKKLPNNAGPATELHGDRQLGLGELPAGFRTDERDGPGRTGAQG